jgi:hypothetical protein
VRLTPISPAIDEVINVTMIHQHSRNRTMASEHSLIRTCHSLSLSIVGSLEMVKQDTHTDHYGGTERWRKELEAVLFVHKGRNVMRLLGSSQKYDVILGDDHSCVSHDEEPHCHMAD